MKTAAELKAEQQARESANLQAREKAAAEQAERERATADAELRKLVDTLKATWGEQVAAASNKDGIRFLALAIVTEPCVGTPVEELFEVIRQHGYRVSLVTLKEPPQARSRPEGHVTTHDAEQGWHPGSIPTLRTGGMILKTVIVSWS